MSHPAFPEWRSPERRCGNCNKYMTVQEAVDAGEGYNGGVKFHASCYEEWLAMDGAERSRMYSRVAMERAQEDKE